MITYTIVPIQHVPPLTSNGDAASGLGNVLFNGYVTRDTREHRPIIFAAGPAVQFPTRTNASLGSNRLALGPAGLIYLAVDNTSGGVVLQNLWLLGGDGVNDVDLFSAQYFFAQNLPHGWFLQSNATITANWTQSDPDRWTVPLGGGVGRVFPLGDFYGSTALQAFWNAKRPTGVGAWTVIAQFQIILGQ
jgi:hypothetical protein